MSKTPNFDSKVKSILDATKPGERVCELTGEKWFMDEEEIGWYKKFNVPPSRVEPELRKNMLNGFNTGLAIFWNKDAETGEPILTSIHPDSPFKAVEDQTFFTTDYLSRGIDFDSQRRIFDHIWQLETTVPFDATRNVNVNNSVAIASIDTTDSYMANGSIATRCFYTYAIIGGEDSIDVANGEGATRCYRVGGSQQLADCVNVFESNSCMSSAFLFDCWNCEFCFGATNKRNKKYLWFNEQLSREEYESRRSKVDLSCASEMEKYLRRFYGLIQKDGIWPETFSFGNDDSDGEHVFQCVRCHSCYWLIRSTDSFGCRFGLENNGNAYCSGNGWTTNNYMCTGGTYGSDNRFCMASVKTQSSEYCINCFDCEHCFGCVGLRRKAFCIFNKQYSEDDYWPLVNIIKCQMLDQGDYGEFFPLKFSPSGPQFSTEQIYVGIVEDELVKYGALIYDPKRGQVLAPRPINEKPIPVSEIPDCLDDIDPAKFVGWPIHDEELDRDYSVLPQEFELYKQRRLPFPRRHFVSRLTDLIRHSNSPIKENTTCESCRKPIVTYKNFTFPTRKIYCHVCYLEYLEKYG